MWNHTLSFLVQGSVGPGAALVHYPPGISSECQAQEIQSGVNQVPDQSGNVKKSCDIM